MRYVFRITKYYFNDLCNERSMPPKIAARKIVTALFHNLYEIFYVIGTVSSHIKKVKWNN